MPDERDPLKILQRQWVEEDDPIKASALLEARRELENVYSDLRKQPADRPNARGVQASRMAASQEAREILPESLKPLVDWASGVEEADVVAGSQAAHAEKLKEVGYKLPLEKQAKNLYKKVAFGYSLGGRLGLSPKEEQSYDRFYQEAISQRLMEEHPDWSPEQIDKAIEGGAQARPGAGGYLMEKAAPLAVDAAATALPMLVAGAPGMAIKGAGMLASATRAGIAGGIYGAARAREQGEEEGVLERLKSAAVTGGTMAVAGGLGNLASRIPGPPLAKKAYEAFGASTGLVAASDPKAAWENPGATLADAALFAIVGAASDAPLRAAGRGIRKLAGTKDASVHAPPGEDVRTPSIDPAAEDMAQAAKVRVAATEDLYDRATKQALRVAEGFDGQPRYIDSEVVRALTEGRGNAGAAEGARRAAAPAEPAVDASTRPEVPVPAAEAVQPGALQAQVEDVVKAAADHETAEGVAPATKGTWQPGTLRALDNALHAYKQAQLIDVRFPDGSPARRKANQDAAARVLGSIDQILAKTEGVTLEQLLTDRSRLEGTDSPGLKMVADWIKSKPVELPEPVVSDRTESDAQAVVQYERALAAGKSGQSPDKLKLPGKSMYDVAKARFVAQHGEQAWLQLSKAERSAEAALVKEELLPRVAEIQAKQMQVDDFAKEGVRLEVDKDGLEYMHSGLFLPGAWSHTRKLARSMWDSSNERRIERTKKDIASEDPRRLASKLRHVGSVIFGDMESPTSVTNGFLDLERRRDMETANIERRVLRELKPLDGKVTDETMARVFDALENFRHSNNGKPLPQHVADAKWRGEFPTIPAEQQPYARTLYNFYRRETQAVWRALEEASGQPRRATTGYVPRMKEFIGPDWKAKLATAMPELAEDFLGITKETERDIENDHGRLRKEGHPFVENLLHRTPDQDPADFDHNLIRVALRYFPRFTQYVGNVRVAQFKDRSINGDYSPMRLAEGKNVREALLRYTGDEVSKKDAIKIGSQFFQLGETPRGDGRSFRLTNIGGAGSIEVRAIPETSTPVTEGKVGEKREATGKLRFQSRTTRFDETTKTWQPAGEWKETDLLVRQGGLAQLEANNGFVNPNIAAAVERTAARIIGKTKLGALETAFRAALKTSNLVTLGFFKHTVAVKNKIVGEYFNLSELGAKYWMIGRKEALTEKARTVLKDIGIHTDRISRLERVMHDDSKWKKFVAGLDTAADKTAILLQLSDYDNKAVVAWGAYRRAIDEMKTPGFKVSSERAAAWRKRGIAPDEFAGAYAREEAMAAATRTGAMMTLTSTPNLATTMAGRLISQFKRPALMVGRAGMQMLGEAIKKKNFVPATRFLVTGAVVAMIDEWLESDTGSAIGPRLSEVGGSWVGGTVADAFPQLEDPDSGWRWVGGIHLPFADPYGAGPVLTSIGDFGRLALAQARGDTDEMMAHHWRGRDIGDRLMDSLVPFHQQLQTLSNAITPGEWMSTVVPSGDPDAPWAKKDTRGRVTYLATDEELRRQAIFGAVGSSQTRDALALWSKQRREQDKKTTQRAAARSKYTDLVQEWTAKPSPRALQEAKDLESEFGFKLSDARREELMRRLPAWAKSLQGTNDDQASQILERYHKLYPDGVTKKQLLDALDYAIVDFSTVSKDRRDAILKMKATLDRD